MRTFFLPLKFLRLDICCRARFPVSSDIYYFSKINASFIYYIDDSEILLIPDSYSFPDEIEKALIIRSGLIPKSNMFDGRSNYRDLPSTNWKGYYNISRNDLMLLEKAIHQKATMISIN